MADTIEDRARKLAVYIIENGSTVRQAAHHFGVSKSTVHKDVSQRLPKKVLFQACRETSFQGKATLSVVANRNLPDETILLSLPLSLKEPGEWAETKRIMEKKGKLRIGDDTKFLSFRLEAEFSGALLLSQPVLHIRQD